ncbi:TIGR03808 family TAT-translocated repetitive protein [Arsenicitalea aurantiaca]|nr:TIGR03808 family TAT-translocated repetitive protein [Arsenicitalea aurantiaca]
MQTRSPRPPRPDRRLVLKGAVAGLIGLVFARPALGQGGAALARGLANGLDHGLVPGAAGDQSAALQRALNEAAALGIPLFLPGGRYEISDVALPARSILLGAGPQTMLAGRGGSTVLSAEGADDIAIMDLSVDGSNGSEMPDRDGLIAIRRSSGLRLERIAIANAAGNGLYLEGVAGRLRDLNIGRCTRSAIFALDGTGLSVTGAAINDCGNAGIRIWRERPGSDGTILTGNRIARIDWTGGGNGQNGNGINVFNADDVIVSDNHLSDCAFSAIRLNTTAMSGYRAIPACAAARWRSFRSSGSQAR